MARTLALTLLIVFAFLVSHSTTSIAQPVDGTRMLHTQGLVLDDGNGHTYSVFVPALPASVVYFLPVLPSDTASAGFVNAGLLPGQTLYWDRFSWVPASDLVNDGTNITATGSVSAQRFVGDGSQIANLNPTNIASGIAAISITGNAATATTATKLTGNIPESQVTNLTTDLSNKATDASVVHLAGAETISGAKTFSSTITGNISGNAATATNLTGNIPESQVTNLTTDLSGKATDASVVHLAGAETISGAKTFSNTITGNISGSAATATTATNLTGNIPESQVTNLTTDLSSKATDAAVVHIAGAETISGAKTFSSGVTINATAQVSGFKLPTGATANYVLTSDASGTGTWQAAAGGGGGGSAFGSSAITADTGKSVGVHIITTAESNAGIATITCANLTANSAILVSLRKASSTYPNTYHCPTVGPFSPSGHYFKIIFATGGDIVSGDAISWMVIN